MKSKSWAGKSCIFRKFVSVPGPNRSSVETSHKVKAGVIEWPFEFLLDPAMPESIEGMANTFVVYHLHASVSRPSWNSRSLTASEHIRLVRTLGPDSLDMAHSRTNADVWANKISYSISIPTDAFVFGTSITADVELSPIKKGLRLGNIDLRLSEHVTKRLQLRETPDARLDRSKTEEYEVANTEMEFPEHSRVVFDDETIDDPVMGDEMYRFKATLPLPKSLNACRQDVDSHQISVTHKFKLMVNLHNPEGHVSQLVCRLPVKIFISPNLPLNEENEVCRPLQDVSDEAINSNETAVTAPPQYGLHQLDELFGDIDLAGYMSRVRSHSESPGLGTQTPDDLDTPAAEMADWYSRSQPQDQHAPSANALRSRLVRLQVQSQSAPSSPGPDSGPPSRRTSGDDHTADIRRNDYDMDDLSRVPSYRHALRTPRSVSPHASGLPSYIEATSRPSSPHRPPPRAHVRPDPEAFEFHAERPDGRSGADSGRSSMDDQAPRQARSSRRRSLVRNEGARTQLVQTES